MLGAAQSLHAFGNYLEAALWIAVALAFTIVALRRRSPVRQHCFVAAVTFAAFGISDIVEVQTGAWWRPWWLLVWKGVCLFVFAALLRQHVRARRDQIRSP